MASSNPPEPGRVPGAAAHGPFHAGELAVQQRAGVAAMAARVGRSIHPAVPAAAAAFLAERAWVLVATTDAAGRPWASVLAGAPGFARVTDADVWAPAGAHTGAHTVRLATAPTPGDPLAEHLAHPAASEFAGLLAMDLSTRRRMRVNGRLAVGDDGALLIRVEQAYANCPKYIQARAGDEAVPHAPGNRRRDGRADRRPALTDAQRAWVRRADTFFIATANPGEGADVSHRGGPPGFVAVDAAADGDRLVWPDYAGNAMFNTLGNLAAYPPAGLLVPDFTTGDVLQLTGRARVDWDPAHAAAVPGAERLVAFTVDEVVELRGALPAPLRLLGYSPFNPPPAAPPSEETAPELRRSRSS